MVWAGWVFYPGVYPGASGAAGPSVDVGVWFHPILRVGCPHAQARCPPAGELVLGRPTSATPPDGRVKKEVV